MWVFVYVNQVVGPVDRGMDEDGVQVERGMETLDDGVQMYEDEGVTDTGGVT